MKIILTLLLVLAPILSQAAFGVSERSVKKWDDEKLCKKAGELELKEDWKAVAIISGEIAARENLDVEVCAAVGQAALEEAALEEASSKMSTIRLSRTFIRRSQVSDELFSKTMDKYGENLFMEAVMVACKKKETDYKVIDKAQNYAWAVASKREKGTAYRSLLEIYPLFRGFIYGVASARQIDPEVCSAQGIKDFEVVIAALIQALNQQPKTSQNVDLVFEIGTGAGEVLKEVGEPILTEQIGPIEAQHFCRTGEVDEYLVLYFFKGSLLYQSRYQVTAEQAGKSGDCVEFAGKGSYEIPEAIKAINASAKKEN